MSFTPEMRHAVDQIRDYLYGGGYPDPVGNAEQLCFLFFFYLVEGMDQENADRARGVGRAYASMFGGSPWALRNPRNAARAGETTIPVRAGGIRFPSIKGRLRNGRRRARGLSQFRNRKNLLAHGTRRPSREFRDSYPFLTTLSESRCSGTLTLFMRDTHGCGDHYHAITMSLSPPGRPAVTAPSQ